MNKKGQNIGIGILISVAIALIVGLVLFVPVAQQVGDSTTTYDMVNQSIVVPANGTTVAILGQGIVGTPVVYYENASGVVAATEYRIRSRQNLNGAFTNTYTTYAGDLAGERVNISTGYEPDGYISDGAGRSITNLIPIFFAIGIAVVALVPTTREKILDAIGRMS